MNIRAALPRLAILVSLTLAAGCSGGGGGSTTPTPTYTVTATASVNGAITPASSTVSQGSTTSFTLTPDANYVIENVTGCNGTLTGNTYTTGAITAACAVEAVFALQKHEVSTAPGLNGAITPANSLVTHGSTTTLTVTPDANYVVENVTGCDGTFDGIDTFTTGAITAPCSVSASFVLKSYEVTASADANGAITPASATVSHGSITAFTVTPNTNYVIDNVTGCGGTLAGNIFTTGAITAPCAVSATFAPSYSIGGSVSGLASGVSIMLLNNGGDAETITTNGPFTFARRLLSGDSYSVTLNSQPIGQQCTITNGAGVISGADVGNVAVSCVSIVSPLYPNNGSNWNDYVKNDGVDIRSASDTACAGTESGGYAGCIHGGERRMVRVPGAVSCAGLTASDTLGTFDWRCDTSEGYVRFVSKLKYEKRLADLIDFAVPAWKENSVTVMNGLTLLTSTAATQWWSNPLVIDDNGMTAAEMNGAGTIYLVASPTAQGSYDIGANKVGLVIKPGVTLRGSGSAAVSASNRLFLWVEGSINASGSSNGINWSWTNNSVVRGVEVSNTVGRGIYVTTSHNNSLTQLLFANTGSLGVNLYSSSNNTLLDVTAVGGYGVQIEASPNNVIGMITSANSTSYGISNSTSNNNYIFTASTANITTTGLNINGSANGSYADIAIAHSGWGIVMTGSSYNKFTGLLKVGSNSGGNCSVTSGTNPGLVTTSCANEGSSDATLTTGISLAAAFVGKVVVDDTVNLSDLNGGVLTYPVDPAAFDWTGFTNGLRAWGKEGSVFPALDNRGRWTTGAGRIWDWSLTSADTVVKDVLVLPTANDTLTHTWSTGTTTTFLRHAVELDGDGDGLCESNESCLYTPNIGAYQGHGAVVSTGPFIDGTISGVTLLRYASNGR